MNITSSGITIYTKEDKDKKIHYRTGLSTKKQDGSYDIAYIDVKMPKGTELENKTKITITNGFLSFYNYTGKDNKQHTIWYIVVLDYTKQEQLKETQVYQVESYTTEQLDNDTKLILPF